MLAFVYGTLVDADRAATVLDEWTFEGDAVLDGLHRVEGEYPTLAPGGAVQGRLLRTPNVDRLDAYEGVDRGLYARQSVPGDAESVHVYVGDPESLGAPDEWPGEGPFVERVRASLDVHDVHVRTANRRH